MLDWNSLSHAIELVIGLVESLRRTKHCYLSSQRFFCRIAVQSLCARVPAHNDAVERFAENSVVRAFDDGGQPPSRFLDPLPVGQVAAEEDECQADHADSENCPHNIR